MPLHVSHVYVSEKERQRQRERERERERARKERRNRKKSIFIIRFLISRPSSKILSFNSNIALTLTNL